MYVHYLYLENACLSEKQDWSNFNIVYCRFKSNSFLLKLKGLCRVRHSCHWYCRNLMLYGFFEFRSPHVRCLQWTRTSPTCVCGRAWLAWTTSGTRASWTACSRRCRTLLSSGTTSWVSKACIYGNKGLCTGILRLVYREIKACVQGH